LILTKEGHQSKYTGQCNSFICHNDFLCLCFCCSGLLIRFFILLNFGLSLLGMINFCIQDTFNRLNWNRAIQNQALTRFFPDQKKWENIHKVLFNF
jgi:hypothetical protein